MLEILEVLALSIIWLTGIPIVFIIAGAISDHFEEKSIKRRKRNEEN